MFPNRFLYIGICFSILLVEYSCAEVCHATPKSYTANDGLVLIKMGHIVTFSTDCPKDVIPLYANLNGQTLPVIHSEDGRLYQVSWTTELSSSFPGSLEISIFDENGFQQLKKAQRSGSTDAKPLFVLPFQHQSPYSGPIVRTEFTVLLVTMMISYYAITLRFKIIKKII